MLLTLLTPGPIQSYCIGRWPERLQSIMRRILWIAEGLPPGSVGGEGVRLAEGRDHDTDRPPYSGVAVVQEPVYNSEPPGAPSPRVITAPTAAPPRPTAGRPAQVWRVNKQPEQTT